MKQRWEDWINLVLGVWLFFSPFFMHYTMAQASWNAYVFGVAIVIFAIWALSSPKPWEEWVNTVLGAWLLISPWAMNYSSESNATTNAVIVGAIVLVLSLESTRMSRQIRAPA